MEQVPGSFIEPPGRNAADSRISREGLEELKAGSEELLLADGGRAAGGGGPGAERERREVPLYLVRIQGALWEVRRLCRRQSSSPIRDRTLLRMDGQISPYTLETLGKCREKGFMIMAATARPEPSIRQLLDQVRFDAVTTLNGARILLPGRVLEHAIPAESGETVLGRLLVVPGLTFSVEKRGGDFRERPDTRVARGGL